MAKLHTHYDNLKVARDAPAEVIRAAYKTLTQKYHPDKNPGDERAARVMTLLNRSYAVLSDPDQRRQHDAWITSQENAPKNPKQPEPAQPPPGRAAAVRMPEAGTVRYIDLPDAPQRTLRERARGQRADQIQIPLKSIRGNIFWSALFALWFVYLFQSAVSVRWQGDTSVVFLIASAIAAILIAHNAQAIHAWYKKPFRPSLIITPLYVIKTSQEHAAFWPLHEAREFRGTHHHRNGIYQYTEMTCKLGGRACRFVITPQSAFNDFVRRFEFNLERLTEAVKISNQPYIDANDDFRAVPRSESTKKQRYAESAKLWITAIAASLVLSAVAVAINNRVPSETSAQYSSSPPEPESPIYAPTPPSPAPSPDIQYELGEPGVSADEPAATSVAAASPARINSGEPAPVDPALARELDRMVLEQQGHFDHIKAHLGRSPPTNAGYVPGKPQKNKGGYSTVTVDNSGNDADVLVKLVHREVNSEYPVRVFFIPEHRKFKVRDVRAGRYDIRYMDRWSGELLKSEPFELIEQRSDSGVRFSNITMTLYKVADGNFQTYPIPQDEF